MAFYLYKKYIKNKRQQNTNQEPIHELVDTQDRLSPTRLGRPEENQNSPVSGGQHDREKLANHDRPIKNTGDQESSDKLKDEKKLADQYRRKLMLGLLLPFTVQALDVTIIASAVPFIASDFKQLSQLNWIISAFNICNAAFIPFWGQFADIFGRYAAIQGAGLVTLIGSVFCSAAPLSAFPMLLVGRALQGAGCAGLLIITKIILADKVSLKENARNNTIFTVFAGIGYGVGPVVGGFLTSANWRYCFVINIPLGVLGLILVHFVLRKELLGPQPITRTDGDDSTEIPETFANKLSTIDFGGQVLFLFGMGLLVLALTWAGSYYPWKDVKVIVPLALSVILLVAFLTWEYFLTPGRYLSTRYPLQKCMIPLPLLTSRNAGFLCYINFSSGMAMYAVFYFANLYFVLVESLAPGEAGRNLIYYMPGLGVGAYAAMFACNVWPLSTWYPLCLGSLVEPLGVTLLAVAISKGDLPWVYGMLGLTGFGTGIRFMPGTLHGVGYHPDHISKIISLMSLTHTLGGTIATALMINILNNHLSANSISFSSSAASLHYLSSLTPSELKFFKDTTRTGIVLAFFASTSFLWLCLVAVGFLGNVRIGKTKKSTSDADGAVTDTAEREDVLTRGSFVASWFRKEKAHNDVVESGTLQK